MFESYQSRITTYLSFKEKPIPDFEVPSDFEEDCVLSAKDGKKIRFPCVNILDDLVLKKSKKEEYENQKFFSDKVLEQVSQHFPLVYNQEEKDGYVFFTMEKFDGDYDELEESGEVKSIDEFISIYLQVFMALYTIDSYGLFHGDLNPGNILFKKIESESPYLKYVIKDKIYYVKHFNRLWVLTDFEYMGEKGVALETINKGFDTNFFKRIFQSFYDKISEPVKGSWLYDMYVFAHFTSVPKMAERLFNLMNQNQMSDESSNPIEAIPHIIKNDLTDLFIVCEESSKDNKIFKLE